MDETQSVYPGMRYDLRLGWVSVGPGEPEDGIRQPTLWGFTITDGALAIASCERPGHKYSYCDCGPFEDDEVLDQDWWGSHGDTCDCYDCDGGGWSDADTARADDERTAASCPNRPGRGHEWYTNGTIAFCRDCGYGAT